MKNKRRARSGLKKRMILIVIILEIWVICCGPVGCDMDVGGVNACSSGAKSRGTFSTEGTNSVNGLPTGNDPAAEPPADPEQEPEEEPDADPMGAPPSSLDTGSKSGDFILKIDPPLPDVLPPADGPVDDGPVDDGPPD